MKRLEDSQEGSSTSKREQRRSAPESVSDAVYVFLRRFIRRLLSEDGYDSTIGRFNFSPSDEVKITHQGSCHCGSVRFEVVASRRLAVQDGSGKIQYRYTVVKASDFRVVEGKEFLKTYYVVPKGTSDRGAHVFCSRCGVHVLYAPSKESSDLYINVNCFDEGIHKLRVMTEGTALSDGTPLEGQWDEQLKTISEVSAEPRSAQRPQNVPPEEYRSDHANWKVYKLYDQNERWYANTFSTKPTGYPVAPATPSTADSYSATTDSQTSRILGMEQDLLTQDLESTGSTDTPIAQTTNAAVATSRLHADLQQPTTTTAATPQLRDQMRYFMGKHLTSPAPKKSSSTDATAAVEEENEAQTRENQ